ncbi:hypothetical protein MKW94_000106 [Papaver nudicaule]|uniref:DUF3615 domain-containing protein n=1 Tax=Papaver nudicaule TaxID=74823 RepID=A0AA41V9C7_PAPNU|nr:hypothetical protein [Papaver nudicaule]
MVVLRSQKVTGSSSSSNSKNLRSKDVSDPSLDGSKRLCSRVVPAGYKIKSSKARRKVKYKSEQQRKKRGEAAVRPYATAALRFYNKEEGTKYKLVQPRCLTSTLLPTCFLHHIDFTAKKADVADAPEEMFFAELNTSRSLLSNCANALGQKTQFQVYINQGCSYCNMYGGNVHHPTSGGFEAGGFMNFEEWDKNYNSENEDTSVSGVH